MWIEVVYYYSYMYITLNLILFFHLLMISILLREEYQGTFEISCVKPF